MANLNIAETTDAPVAAAIERDFASGEAPDLLIIPGLHNSGPERGDATDRISRAVPLDRSGAPY